MVRCWIKARVPVQLLVHSHGAVHCALNVNGTAHLAFTQEISMKTPADAKNVTLHGQDPYAVRVEYRANIARMEVFHVKTVAVAYTAIGLGGDNFAIHVGSPTMTARMVVLLIQIRAPAPAKCHGAGKLAQLVFCQRKHVAKELF